MTQIIREVTVNLNPPISNPFHHKLRTIGEWCKSPKDKGIHHYFIAAAPLSDLAISFCFHVTHEIASLSQVQDGKHCLACELFLDMGKDKLSSRIEERQRRYADRVRKTKSDQL